jgi:RNA polymerase sigma-70 factor (ECF subfamily)
LLEIDDPSAVIRGLHDGSRDAWAALYDRYCEEVWRYVARLLGPSAAAVADIVQETFLAAARSARSFNPERGSLVGWLRGIAHHRVHMYWRQVGRVERLRKLAESGAAEIRGWLDRQESPDNASPDGDWNRAELADLVRGALAEMSADYAALLSAKYLDERSLDEIAREEGCSIDAAKSKLARARREFRAKFECLTREPTPTARA